MAESHKEVLDTLEDKVEDLRRRFDMYFQGLERRPPTDGRDRIYGELMRLRGESGNWSTVDRFRVQTVYQKFLTFDRMWQRTMKSIEEGTHKRDKMKVAMMKERDAAEALKKAKAKPADDEAEDVSLRSLPEGAPAGIELPPFAPPSGAAGRTDKMQREVPTTREPVRRAPPSADGGMNDQRMKQLYDVYMQAKKRTGEKSGLTYEALAAQIKKQIPAIKAKHGCESVDFKVVLKDGKAMLKAIPK